MPRQTYRKKRSRKQRQKRSRTRCNTRRHRGGDYTDATSHSIDNYPFNPKYTVITVNGLTMSIEEYMRYIASI